MPNPLPKKRIFISLSLFIAVLLFLRVGWIWYFQSPGNAPAEEGVIDLRDWNFTDGTANLDGTWEFYPDRFIPPTANADEWPDAQTINVPGDWSDVKNDMYGSGTYRLRIKLPDEPFNLYGIHFKELKTSAAVYLNGRLLAEYNEPNEEGRKEARMLSPLTVYFPNENRDAELVVHVSNYEYPFWSGILQPVKLGPEEAISKEAFQSPALQLATGLIYLLHAVYAYFIYFSGKKKKQKHLLFFGLFLTASAFGILIDDTVVMKLPFGVALANKLLIVDFMTVLLLMLYVIKHLFSVRGKTFAYLTYFHLFTVGGILLLPFDMVRWMGIPFTVFYVVSVPYLVWQTLRIIRKGYHEAILILLWIIAYTSNITWGTVVKTRELSIPYYPIDFLILLAVIVLLLFRQHQRVVRLNEVQTLQLQEADQRKNEFLANTAHELRNPLHGIISIAQSLLDDRQEKLPKQDRHNIELLVTVGRRMTSLLNDLLDAARLRDGFIQIEQKSISLQGVVLGVFDFTDHLTEGKKLQLKMEIPDDFPPVHADEDRLTQILLNLVQNAVKFTEKGTVTVRAGISRQMAAVQVADTGIGIEEEMLERLFLPYEQSRTSNGSYGGFGLGLSICKELVELHGGNIWATSDEGRGTVITFTLPLAQTDVLAEISAAGQQLSFTQEAAESPALMDKEAAPEITSRILVVDDDAVNVRVLKTLLEAQHDVVTARSGYEALEHVRNSQWDLVISDVMMPRMTGYQLTREIRKIYTIGELPILLLTARNQIEDIFTGFQAGANDYVSKPVEMIELRARVEGLLELRRSIDDQLRTEAAWLQAQIQPHFLFNTLSAIASLAEIDIGRMNRLLEEFSNYLRGSFDIANTSALVPLNKELDLLRSYLYIEQERFQDRLHVEWDMESTSDVWIPPLSIQPLVENAVRHGIMKKIEGGTVTIRLRRHRGFTDVFIIDDGVGMTSEKVKQLLEMPASAGGIGVSNTNRRFKQLFGSGLHIASGIGEGTEISFRIPDRLKKRDGMD